MADTPARPATLRDVCRLAEVSLGTASRVLNPVATRDNTSPETRERVRAAAARLGYRVNAAARGVRGGRQGAVLWLQSADARPRGRWEGLGAFAAAMDPHGIHAVLCPLPTDPLAAGNLPKAFRESLGDAAALCLGYDVDPATEEHLRRLRLPWVLVNGRLASDCIAAGDEDAGAAVTARLIAAGHRRIAYVDHGCALRRVQAPLRTHCSRGERQAGYLRAMAAAGLAPRLCLDGDSTRGDADQDHHLRLLLAGPDRPTAVVTQSLPTRVPAVAAELGLAIPRDLSLASPGLDAHDCEGAVSGAAVDWAGIGAAAADLVRARLAEPARALPPLVVPHRLHPGATIAPPPA